ncbi:hypothetical protein CMI38_03880 [Candidatus Pacearchaeota archaeon]|jgi:hypothetical protein|nr:hypothetical protein [Candidatus Pacearchaeota archaeon]|tara:strand:+ start:852 stop:1535 length:684 start_codon:yes stop_codon:yes gene_type:complete
MERKGKYFELGYPNFTRGIDYTYPNQDIEYKKLFQQKKKELEPFLLNNLKNYIIELGVSTMTPCYPYSQFGREGICLHLGDGGRWIEVWDMMGSHFISEHNLDSYKDRAACFNTGSDILEYLDKSLLAPRIHADNDQFTLEYPLPENIKLIPSNKLLENDEGLRRIFKLGKLGDSYELKLSDSYQEISTSKGVVHIENGICNGRDFQGFSVAHASWPIAKLLSLCSE